VPAIENKETETMETVLVGYDNSDASRRALTWGIDHARRSGAQVLLVYAISTLWEWELAAVQVNTDELRTQYRRLLETEWSEPLREADIQYRTRLLFGRPADVILECARKERASLIVIGMTARGTLAELVHSTVRDLLHHAARPVVAVPAHWDPADIERN
jgi:nucleotide-binding universal stress UspA family protein